MTYLDIKVLETCNMNDPEVIKLAIWKEWRLGILPFRIPYGAWLNNAIKYVL